MGILLKRKINMNPYITYNQQPEHRKLAQNITMKYQKKQRSYICIRVEPQVSITAKKSGEKREEPHQPDESLDPSSSTPGRHTKLYANADLKLSERASHGIRCFHRGEQVFYSCPTRRRVNQNHQTKKHHTINLHKTTISTQGVGDCQASLLPEKGNVNLRAERGKRSSPTIQRPPCWGRSTAKQLSLLLSQHTQPDMKPCPFNRLLQAPQPMSAHVELQRNQPIALPAP
ncbi:hypothetical protein GOP47_0026144, partial [Adiantum capillus-veneris]